MLLSTHWKNKLLPQSTVSWLSVKCWSTFGWRSTNHQLTNRYQFQDKCGPTVCRQLVNHKLYFSESFTVEASVKMEIAVLNVTSSTIPNLKLEFKFYSLVLFFLPSIKLLQRKRKTTSHVIWLIFCTLLSRNPVRLGNVAWSSDAPIGNFTDNSIGCYDNLFILFDR